MLKIWVEGGTTGHLVDRNGHRLSLLCGGTQENDFGAKTGGEKKGQPAHHTTPHHTIPLLSVYWKVGTAWAEPGSE